MAKNRFRELAAAASRKTDAKFAAELTELTKFTRADLARLLPEKADQVRLAELMAIVDSSARENRKLADLRAKFDELGPVMLKVLKALT